LSRGRTEAAPRVAAVLLAAGRSRRFGFRNKLLMLLRGRPLLWHALAAACASRARPLIVVTGHQQARVRKSLRDFMRQQRRPPRLRIVFNARYRQGMSTSLQAGLATLPADCAGAVICLGDMPEVTPRLIDALIAAYVPGDSAVLPFAAGGQRGNPVLLGRLLFAIARELRGDEGARRLLTKAPGLRQIKAGSAALRDVDTQREWRAIATTRKALRRVSRESWNANCRCSW
jgi:molybdenum cofactor cytidylyltransferase